MKKIHYEKGEIVGSLVFIGDTGFKNTKRVSLFQCGCGAQFEALVDNVKSGKTTRCAECKNKHLAKIKITHGCTIGTYRSDEYIVWGSMMNRCYNQTNHAFDDYGGRGIRVCKRWHDFRNFLTDMGKRPTSKHTLDRTKNNKGYSRSNCRWVTAKEQANNRRSNLKILYKGRVQSLMYWVDELNLNYSLVYQRIRDGWAVNDAFEIPSRKINA